MVWGQKPKMSKTPENRGERLCRNGKQLIEGCLCELMVQLQRQGLSEPAMDLRDDDEIGISRGVDLTDDRSLRVVWTDDVGLAKAVSGL